MKLQVCFDSWMKIYQVAASFVNPFCSLSFDWRLFRMIISHLFCTHRDFQPDKDQVTRPPPEWIKGSRTVAWRVVTSQWSFQETQIKLEYWRYCGTVAWHIVTSQWIFEETQLSATAKCPAAPPDTRMEFVWWPESLLYNNHRLRCNSFINQLPSS